MDARRLRHVECATIRGMSSMRTNIARFGLRVGTALFTLAAVIAQPLPVGPRDDFTAALFHSQVAQLVAQLGHLLPVGRRRVAIVGRLRIIHPAFERCHVACDLCEGQV